VKHTLGCSVLTVRGATEPGPTRNDRASVVPLLATTLIGSYPQPDWLIDRERLRTSLPPRVRARELWRVPEPFLAQAQDDATTLAIRDFDAPGSTS
jgi:5-methyltetrahydropteroyltriglutamate--homocysteine methyltransferase